MPVKPVLPLGAGVTWLDELGFNVVALVLIRFAALAKLWLLAVPGPPGPLAQTGEEKTVPALAKATNITRTSFWKVFMIRTRFMNQVFSGAPWGPLPWNVQKPWTCYC